MAKNLLIVESPAKATTINRYLGNDFIVLASYGHIRDLPSKDGAVDTENNFAMNYELSEDSKRHVNAIIKAAKGADNVYLATDLDREGEAISWHLFETLREKGLTDDRQFYRVEFSEITKKAIREAVENPRDLSMDLVNAQQARRALDHLVGFSLSPLLWRKIKTGLSAGRVQSPALRLVVERERARSKDIASIVGAGASEIERSRIDRQRTVVEGKEVTAGRGERVVADRDGVSTDVGRRDRRSTDGRSTRKG